MRRAGNRRGFAAVAALVCLAVLVACGDGAANGGAATDAPIDRSAATGAEAGSQHQILTEDDAGGDVIDVPFFFVDIGLPDKKGLEIYLTGDDASTLRWRLAQKPDPVFMEWYAVDGEPAFETDDLVGDPATAAKVLEFRGAGHGETSIILELVERDPANRTGEPAKRLEYNFAISTFTPRCNPSTGCPEGSAGRTLVA